MQRGARILIVDDEPNVRLMFRTTLAAGRYDVAEAADGEEALGLLHASRPFDLVLLDLRMPLVDGMETLRRMRDEGLLVPVIVVTAHGSVPDAVEALKLGAIDFLQKPIRPEELRGVVAEVVARHGSALEPAGGRPPTTSTIEGYRFGEALARAKQAMNRLRRAEAELFLRRALELESLSAEAHTLLGVLLMAKDEPHAAREEFMLALESDPGFEAARHNLKHLQARFSP
ncbi:response regulator [Tautonia plasticadhaerens]|uniref:Alkaline phosphatase synthesis transcriptional regulatory protein PhoP n=1 Tax=Tautonia plasticadhaerens TaxID=2527974 RepID=A0A518HEA8_9BACT|nr:response regulator [Tautonia plasticadhaerens]QDV39181.1 Alkaline phosphatase synthesis transcriptional regulatory protein PhoP [Tautonia plasticadhaerens]